MDRREAENFVYKSYEKAKKYQEYYALDARKRRPDLTKEIIRKKAGTPCVVVTGSKGKGSVSNLISQILQSRYKVGLLTSPHMVNFCERFKINGQNISDEEFVKQVAGIRAEIEEIDARIPEHVCISPMGIQADLGLAFFNANHTEFNIFECGKGAEFDDVNNVKHEYAVINSIFPEHTRELGETAEAIAADKSHVITGEQKCVYVAEQKAGVAEVICRRAEELGVPVKWYGRDFWAEKIRYGRNGMLFDVVADGVRYADILVPLLGEHQARNCALAMSLGKDVLGEVDIDKVKTQIAGTDWPGRMEILSPEPFMMLDACINSAGCEYIKSALRHLHIRDAAVIIGIPNDKDYVGVAVSMNEIAAQIILTKVQNPHYRFTVKQQEVLAGEGIAAVWTESVDEAVRKAKDSGRPIVILGTTALVSEVKRMQLEERI